MGLKSDWAPGGVTNAPNRLFKKGVRLSLSLSPSNLLCLRSSRSKYNASTINYLLVFCLFCFSTLRLTINVRCLLTFCLLPLVRRSKSGDISGDLNIQPFPWGQRKVTCTGLLCSLSLHMSRIKVSGPASISSQAPVRLTVGTKEEQT